jgi:hypothetical protein
MQGDCPSYETIDIPDGVSLDGTGKTMTLTQIGLDHTRAIRAVGVASAGLRNLTIDAADAAFAMDDAVRFDVGSGLIENVAILNNDGAFTGFNVEGDVDITSVTVDGTALAGIRYGGTGTISDSTVRNIDDFALFILDTGDDPATVEDNELTNVGIGVFVAGTANTTTNTIAGRGGGRARALASGSTRARPAASPAIRSPTSATAPRLRKPAAYSSPRTRAPSPSAPTPSSTRPATSRTSATTGRRKARRRGDP